MIFFQNLIKGTSNDVITFRLYDHQSEAELDYVCDTTYTFVIDDIVGDYPDWYQIHFTDPSTSVVEQTVTLSSGANWFSTNIEITLEDLKAALVAAAPGTAITIQSQTLNTSYNPSNGRWTGRLTTLDVTRMYVITVTTDCEMVLEGMLVNPAEHPVTISSGANWIAYPLDESMSLTNAFAGFAVNGDVVQSQTTNASYIRNRWQGQLTELVPGKGYIYNSSTSESRVFTFPAVR